MHTSAEELLFSGDAQMLRTRASGNHQRFAVIHALRGLGSLHFRLQRQLCHFRISGLGAIFFCLLAHLLSQCVAVNPIDIAGIIVDLRRFHHLPAGCQLFQHHHGHSGSCGIERCGIAAGAAAHDDHIINLAHKYCFPYSISKICALGFAPKDWLTILPFSITSRVGMLTT